MKRVFAVLFIAVGCMFLMGQDGCSDAEIASENLSEAADNFEIMRRVVFYNGITDSYMLTIEGRCSIEDEGRQLEVVCKTGPNGLVKHFLGLSDNVTYFAEQLLEVDVSVYHHRIDFKPQTIFPKIRIRGDVQELIEAAPEFSK